MQHKHLIRIVRLGLFVLILAACGGSSASRRHPAEMVVARYYIGVAAQNTDAVMDAVEPDDRNKTGMGLLNVIDALSLDIGFLGIDLGALTEFSINGLDVELLSRTDDYAAVKASGNYRYLTLGLEYPFCDIHDVWRHSDGRWYIDLDGPERKARLERVLAQREVELAATLEAGGAAEYDLFSGMDMAMDQIGHMLDWCEDGLVNPYPSP